MDDKTLARMYALRADSRFLSLESSTQGALADIQQALKLYPQIKGGYEILGNCFDAEGKHQEALEAYSKAIESGDADRTLYSLRAGMYQQLGQFDKAIEDMTLNIKVSPPSKDYGYFSRAKLYQKVGKKDKALEDYAKTIEIQKKNDDIKGLAFTYKFRALYYVELGMPEKAIADLDSVLKLDKADNESYRLKGTQYEKLGNLEKALEAYSKAIELNPFYSKPSLEGRARVYKALGKDDLAILDNQRAKKIKEKPAVSPVYDFKKK